jgi:hypothetical protein
VSAHDVRSGVVGPHRAEALRRVDNEQPVADHFSERGEVGTVPRPEVDETHRERPGVVGDRLANDLRGDESVRRVEPLDRYRAEGVGCPCRRHGQARELGTREHESPGHAVDRVHQSVRGRRLQDDLRGIRTEKLREQLTGLAHVRADEIHGRTPPRAE